MNICHGRGIAMILETRHLRLVEAVAEHGNLTKAGSRLHLTQSALSHQLLDLEGRLRVPLFHRLGKRMVPTAAGQRLLETANQALPLLRSTEEELIRLGAGHTALLRLSTRCYTCYHWLPAVLSPFSERFPWVEVQIVAEATHQPVDALLAGRIDLAIVDGGDEDDRLEYYPLFHDELVVIMRPEHRLASRPYVAAEDFAEEHLIVYAPRSESTVFRQVLMPAGVTPRRMSEIQLTEAIIEMVKAGIGISVLARWAVLPHLQAGTIEAVPLTRAGFHREWKAAVIAGRVPEYIPEFTRLLARGPATGIKVGALDPRASAPRRMSVLP
jgi:LysR family transcriptional regulator, regulator for metE and metH